MFREIFVGPSWRAVDRSVSNVVYPSPQLLLVEVVSVSSPGLAPDAAAVASRWQLTPYSIVSLYIHLYNAAQGKSYLISCSCLQSALNQAAITSSSESCAHGSGSQSREAKACGADNAFVEEYNDNEAAARWGAEFQPSVCIPTVSSGTKAPLVTLKGLLVVLDPFIE